MHWPLISSIARTHCALHSVCPGIRNTNFPLLSECRKCVRTGKRRSCCDKGGSWQGKCGSAGDNEFEHTWNEGISACETKTNLIASTAPKPAALGKCPDSFSWPPARILFIHKANILQLFVRINWPRHLLLFLFATQIFITFRMCQVRSHWRKAHLLRQGRLVARKVRFSW